MSRTYSTSLFRSAITDPSSNSLLDDCALDQTLGVLRRSCPRTYAGRVSKARSTASSELFRRKGSGMLRKMKCVFAASIKMGSNISRLAQQVALTTGFVAAAIAIFASIQQQGGATAHAASGFISFATVSTMTLLLLIPSMHLLAWLGVDLNEIVADEE